MNGYRETLITVADDCPVLTSQVPVKAGVAAFQYALLADHPYQFTMEDVLLATHYRNEPDQAEAHRDEFFSQPRACLRASPLPKKHGFGFHFDEHGKVALLAFESLEYQQLLSSGTVKVVKAMRSKREGKA